MSTEGLLKPYTEHAHLGHAKVNEDNIDSGNDGAEQIHELAAVETLQQASQGWTDD